MSGHLAPHLLVLLPLLLVPLVHSQAGLSQLPGIEAWQAAIQQHSLAEGKLAPKKEGEVPGLADWEAHQRAVLEAERRLEQGGEQRAGEGTRVVERVNTQTNDAVKASIQKLLSKLLVKGKTKGNAKSKVETLLEAASQKKLKEHPREVSFLDKLLETYSQEERKKALESVGKDDSILRAFEARRQKKPRAMRRKKNQMLSFLQDYDYDIPTRRNLGKSSLRVLSGDYLDTLSGFDDYDDYDDGDDVPLLYERPRISSSGRFSTAARESRLIERQLESLLRISA